MTDLVNVEGKVVIITGSGGGLGKQYALLFASRGAKVVVNDLGGTLGGSGTSTKAADLVVDEIKSNGGEAVSNYDNVVTNPEGIVQTAIDSFGTVDILINNAGILKDASFKRMTEQQFQAVLDVHLNGAFKLTRLCWPIFRKQNYGRVVMTTSPAGLYGNFGQTNYSAAKLGLVGFAETLAKEGFKHNIHVNAIAPLAKSRMTETILPPDILARLLPEKIAPLVVYLSSAECKSTGSIYEVAAGLFAQIRWERSGGVYLKPNETLTPEAFLHKFSDVFSFKEKQFPTQLNDYNAILQKTSSLPDNEQGDVKVESLKGKVVIITGAGSGLGRSHALWFARYGAKVVVNDFRDPGPVVEEIKKAGGTAVGSKHDIFAGASEVVQTALDTFGTVDVLVNNAGILRDRSFAKMSDAEWNQVIQVHLLATFRLCKLVWPIMSEKRAGAIINTTSTSGIYGNFGQANYASAKAAVLGFTRSLAIEGHKAGIRCNAVAPHAETSMTRTVFKADELNKFSADQVSPFVVLLASEELSVTGELFEIGAGWAGNTRWQRAKGAVSHDEHISPEFVRDHWTEVVDFREGVTLKTAQESSMAILRAVGGEEEEEEEDDEEEEDEEEDSKENAFYSYNERTVILYNISVGSSAKELKYTYESAESFQTIPTFGVIPFMNQEDGGMNFSSILKNFNPMMLLHGEHYLKIHKFPIPVSGKLQTRSFPVSVINKHKGEAKNALVVAGYETYDTDSGELLFYNEGSFFVRNSESVSGKDEIYKKTENQFLKNDFHAPKKITPDFEAEFVTNTDMAVLYRLNGDLNPLHVDPQFARGARFERPILHGLGTLGISAKILLDHYGQFDEVKVRFTNVVYPGETLRIVAWKQRNVVVFQTWCVERNCVVIDLAGVRLVDSGESKL